MADLLFERPRVTTGDLVFGDDGAPSADAVAEISGEFAPLAGALFSRVGSQAHVVGTFVPLAGVIAAAYDSNTQRPTVGRRAVPWQVADKPNQPGVEAGHRDAAQAPTGWAAFWERATGAPTGVEHRLPDMLKPAHVDHLAHFQDATGVHGGAHFLHQDATRMHARRDGVFQEGSKVRDSTDFRHQDGDRTKRPSRLVLWQDGAALRAIRSTDYQGAAPSPHGWSSLFQDGVPPPPGLSLPPIEPPKPPGCYTPSGELLFSWPWGFGGTGLVFQCGDYGPEPEPPKFVIPLLKVYMTVHSLTAELLPSLEPVVLRDVSIASDDDGYGWSFSGTGPEHLLDQLAPLSGLPRQIRVTLDGISWVFAVQSLSRSRRFGEHRVAVQGASVTALLGDPYMPEQTWLDANGATAQQLVAQALQFTGVGIEWGITDWHVPPGVWSFQGTPLAAALRVAEAAGAVLRSHRTESELIFAPRYPAMPWEWGTTAVNVEMPAAVISTDELRPDARPDYNAVYISGQAGGVLGHVRRVGTAGDFLAPQVTDSLITHADAARQRGRAVLGAGGKKLIQTVTMPLLTGGTNPGLMQPGYLVQVNDINEVWRGLVRGISVNAALPSVRQTISIERLSA